MSRRRKIGRTQQLSASEEEAPVVDSEEVEAVSVEPESAPEPIAEPAAELAEEETENADLLRQPTGPIDGVAASFGGAPSPVINFRPRHPLTVGPNKSVQSARGRLKQGDEVLETDFSAATLARLIEIGCVIDGR